MIKLIQTLIMMYRTNIKKYLVCFTTFWRGKLNNQKYSVRISSNSNLPESDWRTVFSDKVNFPTWLWLEVRILWKEQRINKCINWTRIIYHMQRWTIIEINAYTCIYHTIPLCRGIWISIPIKYFTNDLNMN